MTKQELRAALDKIRPDEALIGTTLAKMEERRQSERLPDRATSYGFTYRLASALCVLVLLIGVGVMIGRDPALAPLVSDEVGAEERQSPMALQHEDDGEDPLGLAERRATVANLIAAAEAEGGTWAVACGSLDGCFFGEVSEEDARAGMICRLTLMISAHAWAEQGTVDYEVGSVSAEMTFSNEAEMQALTDSIGGEGVFRFRADENGAAWRVIEFVPVAQN